MQRILRVLRLPLVAASVLMLGACGGGAPVKGNGNGTGTINGVVVKGAVSGATVTAYKVGADGKRGAALASASSGPDGSFSLKLPAYNGVLEVGATGGVYTEEALRTPLQLTRELVALVGNYKAGATVSVTLSPVSTVAAALARYHVAHGSPAATAIDDAWTHVNGHFGNIDWRATIPADLSSPSVTTFSHEAIAGLVLAGLSQQAKLLSQTGGVTPGTIVSAATLADAAALDAADGTLDGIGPTGVVAQAGASLDGQTFRRGLGQAMLLFLGSAQNGSAITAADAQTLASNLAANSDPYLFCPGQVSATSCAGSAIDLQGPTVTFVSPAANSGVTGAAVAIQVAATDASRIVAFRFTAPAALISEVAALSNTTAELSTTLDVSAFPDGPLTISVVAEDEFHNTSTRDLSVVVANHGPTISVSSPASGGIVSGTLTLTAQATPQTPGASVTSLTLVNPPPGMGTDQLPAANALAMTWDTTQVLEGPTMLRFRAVDTFGSATETTVAVTVDNVPFGVITVVVSAGTPISGATVKVVAVDATSGAIRTDVGAGGVLGEGGPTTASGTYALTLSAENYQGPIRILALPPPGSSLWYLDPTNPASTITIPSAMGLTSYVGSYSTGTAITVPLTLWTTLADAEVLAYLHGDHRKYPVLHSLQQALTFGDHLFSDHVDPIRPSFALRGTVPVSLTQPPTHNLTDIVYAALADVALNQLAHDVGIWAGLGSSGVITAPSLVALLQQDLLADGQLDGLGAGGQQLQTPGSPPYSLDTNLLRLHLANALDEFIQSPRNMTGLTRTNLDNAGVYSTISGDTSDLFGPLVPLPFDNTAPTVTVGAAYGSGSAPPVGPSKLVSGTVHLTVNASDPSGVQAISVKANGVNVPGTLQGNVDGSATFTADYSTSAVPDGTLSFQVLATDSRSNSGTTSYSVTVDNTPPTMSVTNPLGSIYYSTLLMLDASASDANGVASLTEVAKSVLDQDATPSHFLGSWIIPAGVLDGSTTFTLKACDVVQNCANQNVATNIDRTPPAITVTTAPPTYTNQGTVTFVVTAADGGAGVSGVYAQTPGWPPVAGTYSAGAWTLSNVPLSEGQNLISVWGIDNASPPNGGLGSATTLIVTKDSLAPGAAIRNTPSYLDERTMSVGNTVPAVYSWPAGTAKSSVIDGSVVFKAATRVAWNSKPTTAQLEGTNTDNLPFVQIGVATGPVEAPITTATYSIAVNGGSPLTGDLLTWKSAASTSSTTLFDLPLTADTIPALATTVGSFSLSISATFTDAAGNSGSMGPASVTYHVIGAPVYVAEDTAYASYSDPRSTFPYKLASNTYATLFDPVSGAFYAGQVRLLRYIITNPAPFPVGIRIDVTQSPSGSWVSAETWDGTRSRLTTRSPISYSNCMCPFPPCSFTPATLPSMDGFIFSDCYQATGDTCAPTPESQSIPPAAANITGWWTHAAGDTATKAACKPKLWYAGTLSVASSNVAAQAFNGPSPTAGEVMPATAIGSFSVVPAASGGTPGTLVVYVTRPVGTPRAIALGTWNKFTTANRYETNKGYVFIPDSYTVSSSYVWWFGSGASGGWVGEAAAYQEIGFLSAATESVSASLTLTTQGTSGSSLIGESASASTVAVSRSLTTH